MATRDQAQLILEVDARIATAQRAVNQLAKSIQQDAVKIDGSLANVEKSGERVAKSLGQISRRTRSGMTQLSFQIGDVSQGLAMGTKASTIFAQQSGQVIQALQIMGGEGNKFLRFIGGPWGIAIATAAVVLGPLASKLFDTGDEIEALVRKMREQAEQAAKNRRADDLWKQSIEGITEAIRERRKEQEKALKTDIDAEQDSLKQTSFEVARLKAERDRLLKRELPDAKRVLGSLSNARPFEGQESAVANAQLKVDDLQRRVNALQLTIFEAEKNVRGAQATIAERTVEAKVDKTKAATDAYTRTLASLRKALEAGNLSQSEFERRLEAAKRKLDAVKDSAKGAATILTDFGSPVDGGQITGRFGEQRVGRQHAGVDIAVPVGTSVKAPAGGVVIEAGTLPGYGNVVFIDHGGGTVSRLAHLSKIGVAKGQQISAGDIIGLSGGAKGAAGSGNSQGPHVHYEVRSGGKPVDPLKGKFATDEASAALRGNRAAETAEQKALRQANAFSEELARLDQELIRAKSELVQGADAQADAAVAALQAEQERRKLSYDNDAAEGKISTANAELLKAKVDQVTFERLKAVELDRQLDHMERQSELEQQSFGYRIDDMRFADEMARTAAAQRRIQLDILDLVYQQKEAALRDLKARLDLAGKIEQAADVQAQIDRLPTERAQDTSRTLRGTMNPIEAWMANFSPDQIIEDLQSIDARGLDSLADAITGVLMGTESLGEAFGNLARSVIADIIQMTVRMMIFRALTAAIGGGGNFFSPGGSMTFAKGGVFSGGNVIPFARGGIVDRPTLFPMSGGKTGLMGEAGTEAIMPLGRDSMGRLGVRAANAGRNAAAGGVIELIVHSAPSRDAWAQVQQISARSAAGAVPVAVRAAVNQTGRRLSRPKLNGR